MNTRVSRAASQGFTLVEMAVIAPIVILLIGGFISLIVNLTGEVMSSRGANVLVYDVQDALNRIEEDVRLSTTYLAENNVDLDVTRNGYGAEPTVQSATKFTNIDMTSANGSPASLILNTIVTNGNPLSPDASIVYLADEPNDCSSEANYSRNKPMTANIVYFVDENNALWRRVIMPSSYIDSDTYCGDAPWQVSSCPPGYSTAVHGTYCKTNDELLVEGVSPADFNVSYYSSPDATTANTAAVGPTASATIRNNALFSTPTIEVSIAAEQLVAGREVDHSASIRATRLDVNATSIGTVEAITSAPDEPAPVSTVSDGHVVTFTWPRVEGATEYDVKYRITDANNTTQSNWVTPSEDFNNTNRKLVVSDGRHTDSVRIEVIAKNSFGDSSDGTLTTKIPLWAPLQLENDWRRYSTSYPPASYTKTTSGLVMFRGLVRKTSTFSTNEAIVANIPTDYRPSGTLIFMITTNPNTHGRLDVRTNGTITANSVDTGWVSLDGIKYLPASAPYTRVNPSLSNGWVDYGGSYEPFRYAVDDVGRTTTQGLIRDGTFTSGNLIYTHPTSSRPTEYALTAVRAGAYGEVGFSSSGNVVTRGIGTGSWISPNATFLTSSSSATWNNLSLQNGWVRYSTSYDPGYAKTSDGVVQLRGLIKDGSTSTTVAQLPPGFRPAYRTILYGANYSDFTRVDIQEDGTITVYGSERRWLSLSNITFMAAE